MKFHAWFNPYRVTTSGTDLNTLAPNHPARLHPDWLIEYTNESSQQALAYNPGLPEVRKHIVDSINEVVRNYNIDGVHFDDYFYRNGMNDDATYNKYGSGQDKGNWRRENVNTLLKEVSSSIKSIKPSVKFGVSPGGIWKNISSDPTGSDTRGNGSYSSSYADTRAWIKQGLVDYIVPQVYWPIGYSAADYSKLVSWWSNEVKGTNVALYIGQGIYKQGEAKYDYQDIPGGEIKHQNIAAEIKQQIGLNRQYSDIKGSMYFSARDIIRNTNLQNDMKELYINSSINIKATTTTTNVSLRSGPSTKNSIILTIPKGHTVQVIGESGAWSKVSYNQKIGYISSQYIKINENTPSNKLPQSKKYEVTTNSLDVRSAASANSSILGKLTKGAKIDVINISNNWAKIKYKNKYAYVNATYLKVVNTSSNSGKNTPSNNLVQSKKYEVTTNSLNVRSATLANSSILGKLTKGTKIDVINISNNWAKIKYKNKYAYVNATYLKVVNTSSNSSKNAPSNNLVQSKKYEVTTNSLNVRSATSANSSILGKLTKGTKIDVINISNNWAKIKYKNKYAYVNATYLKEIKISKYNNI